MSVDVEPLTRDHKVGVTTSEGTEYHLVPSLLSQLREAIFGGMEATGGGSSMKSRLPISEGALDLYMRIDRDISSVWAHAFNKVPGKDEPEALLSEWAAWADPDTVVTVGGRDWYARDAVTLWMDMIRDFFDPPRLAEISVPCPMPECGERYVYSGEEDVRQSALRFNRSRITGETLDARCLACGAIWLPSQFERLAAVIGIDVEERRRTHLEEMSDVGEMI